jgi:23S rRNA G2445 N2-methylase RlmL
MSTLPPGAGRDESLVAKTLFGLEGVLADELRMLGAKEVKTVPRAVTFVGDLGFIYKCNLMLTTALKVLRPIHQFGVLSKEDLYRGSLEVPADADAATLEQLALGSEVASRWLEGRPPRRVIVVPGKLVNLVP